MIPLRFRIQLLIFCILAAAASRAWSADDHVLSDELIAEAQALAPAFIVPTANPPAPQQRSTVGQWGAVIPWTPHIPVTAATLPNGKLLTFSSNQRTTFPANREFTYAAVWDPATGAFTEYNNTRHDMFCGGTAMLPDGRLVINGGRNTTRLSSIFDWRTNQWSAIQNMNDGRWYNTSVALTDGSVFTVTGDGGVTTAERWTAAGGWTRFTGINWGIITNQPGYVTRWHPLIVVAPDGRLFHGGPTNEMNWINTAGSGSREYAWANIPGTHYPKEGCFAMYDEGRILVAGGAANPSVKTGDGTTGVSTNLAFTIDIRGSTPVVASTNSMKYVRQFVNSVILPTGEVMAIGGNTSGLKFNDTGSILTPEIWNPATGQWRSVADMSVPRNYHSLALLLPDGRVWSGGGGLSGNSADHRDAQIYTPPVLFNADGSAAQRPVITHGPDQIGLGARFMVQASPGVSKFSFIKMSAQTHSMNTDLRYLTLPFTQVTPGSYELTSHSNRNVMTPGYWMLFAVNANGSYSTARVIQVTTTVAPTVGNPGNQTSVIGEVVALPIQVNNPSGDPLTFSATGLPAGLTISSGSGVITGIVTTPGVSNVTISVAGTQMRFNWTVNTPLAVNPLQSEPKPSGGALTYTAQSTGGSNPRFKWHFGDGTPETSFSSNATISHTFPGPGRYLVTLTATDDTGFISTSSFYQGIHAPLTARKPSVSSSIAYEDRATANDRLWVVNSDNDSVSVFDAVSKVRLAETAVGTAPRTVAIAPDGRAWVVNCDSASISILNSTSFAVAQTVTLPRGARPFGIVFDPNGGAAYVVLEATGMLLKLHPSTAAQIGAVQVGKDSRHISVSADGSRIYISRFITPFLPGEGTAAVNTAGRGGEVVVVNGATLAIERTLLLQPSDAPDTPNSARGIPNYLGAAALSPDGLSAWVPSKQDNIQRGTLRNGQPLNHDMTMRAIASRLNITTQAEDYAKRIDFDDAGMPSAAAYDPWGLYVFVALESSRAVAVVDAWAGREILRFKVGRAPQGLSLSPDGASLFVHNFMDRTVEVRNVQAIIQGSELAPAKTATLNCITTERLPAQVLLGKQLFYDTADNRLALQEYISCASCHNDGGHDGRTWDLSNFGEGLRNTITLRGHGNHGVLHWSANFDEVQDFEGQIRNLSGGLGLMSNTAFHSGTRSQPLGDPKAGISSDLDALAAYVKSLTSSKTSPFRTSDGSLTADAAAGQQVFRAQNCASCHSGANFTNSAPDVFANIGTLKPTSGKRLSGPLTGLDVPTLRGLWATAPYLHDGSAATLADAVRAHQGTTISEADLASLVAYLQQIDDAPASAPLPVTATLATAAPSVDTSFDVTVRFNTPVTGFTLSDISVTGGIASNVTGSGTDYTFTVSPQADVTVVVAANAAQDASGLGNLGSNSLSVAYTSPHPTLTLSTAHSTVSAGFEVQIAVSEPLYDADEGDVLLVNGRLTGAWETSTGFAISVEPLNPGIVTVSVPAGGLRSGAGVPNAASNVLQVLYEVTPPPPPPPGPIVTLATRSATVSEAFDISVIVEEELFGAEESDVVITNGYITGASTNETGYNITVQPYAAGEVTVHVPAGGLQNAAGIGNLASNTLLVNFVPPGSDSAPGSGTVKITDFDGDDVNDLIEYAIGADDAFDGGWWLTSTSNGDVDARLTHPSANTDVTFQLETSLDLVHWQPLALTPTRSDAGNGWQQLTWPSLTQAPGQQLERGLVRLRVTHDDGLTAVTAPQAWQRMQLNVGTQTSGLSLLRAPVYAGFVTSISGADSFLLADAPTLNLAASAQPTHYMEIRDGLYAGHRYQIGSIEAGTVKLAASMHNTLSHLPPEVAGSRIVIRPHWMLADVFPKTLLHAADTANRADQILFYEKSAWQPHWLQASAADARWVSGNGSSPSNTDGAIIHPGTGVMVKILNAPKAYTLTGHVRTHPFVKSLPVGHNLLALPWPLNGSPATLGLDVEGGLTGGPTSDSADQLQLWKADSVPGLTSYDGYWLSPDSGWLPMSATVAPSPGGPALPAHRAFFLKVQPATSAQGWLLPAPHVGQ